MNRSYYRIMLGKGGKYSDLARQEEFIGVDFGFNSDLTADLTDKWKDFNKKMIPVWLEVNPGKSKVAAGLACGFTHTVCKGISQGDVVFCPIGDGEYMVGEVVSDYYFKNSEPLPHRRKVVWYPDTVLRESMSQALKNSTGSIGTVSNISKYSKEIEQLLTSDIEVSVNDESIEDPNIFALEKHLEDFLVQNWNSTELGKHYNIYTEDGDLIGQQYPTDVGPIDILAISKDRKTFLVVELKKGRTSDAVVGQVQRYMGYVLEDLVEEDQQVKGAIIAFEPDERIRRALLVTQNIDFYTYQINFKLIKAKYLYELG